MGTAWTILMTALFLLAAAALVLQWLARSGLRVPLASDGLPARAGERPERSALWKVFALAVAFRCVMALAGLLLYNIGNGAALGLADLPELWTRWDGTHYVNLVEQGYAGYQENGQPLFLVFFPLYVWLTRAVGLLVPDTALAGMVVSFACYGAGCVFLYRLGAEEYGKRIARWAVVFLSVFPFGFFFGAVMTESLFFLTTTAALYYIRRHRWVLAGLWGLLAAMTRMQGVLLIGAAAAELVNWARPFALAGKARRDSLLSMAKKLPALLLPVVGSLVYLALNVSVTGDPFAFSRMQAHWSQGFAWFPGVLQYVAKNALTWPTVSTRWEMWVPELVLFFVFAGVLAASWKRHRSMFTLYGFVYFILNYCLSWLLSAGRYLSCGVPFFLFAADLTEKRPRAAAALAVGMGLLQLVFMTWFLSWRQVM